MIEEFKIIWLLAIGLGLACTFGFLAQRARLPSILGYLLAGYMIGPYCPGYVADIKMAEQLAKIGVTLLMFTVGLNYNWKDLLSVKRIALPGALIVASLSIAAAMLYSIYLGEPALSGFVIGLAICVSSTVVIVRVLTDQNLLDTRQGRIVVGWTIVEDFISVFGLVFLPTLVAQSPSLQPALGIGWAILLAIFKIAILGVFLHFVGEKVIHKILETVARTRSHELFTLAILACVFLIAIGSAYLFGVSLALGAFIAGMIVGKTDMSHQAAANALPMRDAFSVIFFLSVGMLFNPLAVIASPQLFFGILAILLFLRPLLAFATCAIARYPLPVIMTVGLAIAQIGEYSFIIAQEGDRLKILPHNAYDVLVACSCITIGLNPLLLTLFHPICTKKISSQQERPFQKLQVKKKNGKSFLPRVVIIGFGPIGQAACVYLAAKGYRVLVIDRNIDTIIALKKHGIETIFGDATQFHILEKAHIDNTRLLIITTPEFAITQAIIQTARHINPFLQIIARARFQADMEKHVLGDIPTICDEEVSSERLLSLIQAQLKE